MLKIQLLGDFRVWVGDIIVPDNYWHLRKAAAIVKLLALSKNHCLLKEYLMETLWPEVSSDTASNNFRYALHKARKALAFPTPNLQYLRSNQDRLFLTVNEPVLVDVEAFEAAISAAQLSANSEDYRKALELYTGPLLPYDLYEDWAEPARENLRLTFRNASLKLSTLYEKKGEFQLAISTIERLRIEEPLEEEITLRLMRLYIEAGQPGFALEKYEQLVDVLREELDFEPSEPIKKLYQHLREGATALPVVLKNATTPLKGNLPGLPTSFIGREAETSKVSQLLNEYRLVTITGIGGSGKTSLALAVARKIAANYTGGVWLADLSSLANPTLVVQRVVTSLGLKLSADSEPEDLLIRALNSTPLLLVLDNCEHLRAECARLVNFLLSACPGLRILATSREVLGVPGELNYALPLLPTPRPTAIYDVGRVKDFASIS